MTAPMLVAKSKTAELELLPALANRHGLVAGATGTGKTVRLDALGQIGREVVRGVLGSILGGGKRRR